MEGFWKFIHVWNILQWYVLRQKSRIVIRQLPFSIQSGTWTERECVSGHLCYCILTKPLQSLQKILICSSEEILSNIESNVHWSSVYKSVHNHKSLNYQNSPESFHETGNTQPSLYLIINSKTSHLIFGISMSLASFSCNRLTGNYKDIAHYQTWRHPFYSVTCTSVFTCR